jgi:hypothetical protein
VKIHKWKRRKTTRWTLVVKCEHAVGSQPSYETTLIPLRVLIVQHNPTTCIVQLLERMPIINFDLARAKHNVQLILHKLVNRIDIEKRSRWTLGLLR